MYNQSNKPHLPREEQFRLVREAQAGSLGAMETLLETNWPFIMTVIRGKIAYFPQFKEDIESVAAAGFCKAVRRFDAGHGASLIYYARYWVKQSVVRFIQDNVSTIRLPVYIQDKAGSQKKEGREVDDKIGKAIKVAHTVSLETPMSGHNGDSFLLQDLIADERAIQADDQEESTNTFQCVRDALELSQLSWVEKQILKLRYGLHDNTEWTLEQIGELLGVTRERVRQKETAAINKIRERFC